MINLLICIALTSLLFVIFKYYSIFNVRTFEAVVFNYITCGVCGLLFTPSSAFQKTFENISWLPYSIVLGCFFIGTFFLMAICTQRLGVTIATTAGKISMVIPILFALFFLDKFNQFDLLNYTGLFLALIALMLTSKQQKNTDNHHSGKSIWLVPAIFILTGTVDSIINFVNSTFAYDEFKKVFPTISFFCAATVGVIILLYQAIKHKKTPQAKSLLGGIALGIPNYFSIYFLMRALSDFDGNGAALFPLSHMGGILFSMLLGIILFKEKLSKMNYLGITLSIVTIFLLGHQKILELLN